MSSTNDPRTEFDFPSILNLAQDEFDLVFFLRLLQLNQCNVDALRRCAEMFAHIGQHDDALELDRRLALLLKDDDVVHYNLACSYSMTGHVDFAIKTLQRAIELGYRDFARIEADSDLDPIRAEPGFMRLLADFDI